MATIYYTTLYGVNNGPELGFGAFNNAAEPEYIWACDHYTDGNNGITVQLWRDDGTSWPWHLLGGATDVGNDGSCSPASTVTVGDSEPLLMETCEYADGGLVHVATGRGLDGNEFTQATMSSLSNPQPVEPASHTQRTALVQFNPQRIGGGFVRVTLVHEDFPGERNRGSDQDPPGSAQRALLSPACTQSAPRKLGAPVTFSPPSA
jgi:hypothetical protein